MFSLCNYDFKTFDSVTTDKFITNPCLLIPFSMSESVPNLHDLKPIIHPTKNPLVSNTRKTFVNICGRFCLQHESDSVIASPTDSQLFDSDQLTNSELSDLDSPLPKDEDCLLSLSEHDLSSLQAQVADISSYLTLLEVCGCSYIHPQIVCFSVSHLA